MDVVGFFLVWYLKLGLVRLGKNKEQDTFLRSNPATLNP